MATEGAGMGMLAMRRGAAVVRVLAVVLLACGTGVFSAVVAAPQACACSCYPATTPEEDVAGYDAVFVGTPVDESEATTDDGEYRIYEFEVAEVYQGAVARTTTIATRRQGTACGVYYEIGQDVLVLIFAKARTDGLAPYSVSSCQPRGAGGVSLTDVVAQVYGPPHAPLPDERLGEQDVVTSPPDARTGLPLWGVAVAIGVGVLVAAAVAAVVWRRRPG